MTAIHAVVDKLFPTTVNALYGFDTNKINVSGVHVFRYRNEDCIRFRPGFAAIDYNNCLWHFEMFLAEATYPKWHQALRELDSKRLTGKEENILAIVGQNNDSEYARALPTWREMVIPNSYDTLQEVVTTLKKYMTVLIPVPSKESFPANTVN